MLYFAKCLIGTNQALITSKVESHTKVIQKHPTKGNAVVNYRSIASLNLLWKLLTGIITDKLYEHLENQDLLPEILPGPFAFCL